ncbi:MAG: 7-cyano-7-deazaguanine synthase [Aquificaceae bacterium]
MSTAKVAVLFSGGVESTSLLYMYLQRGFLVYPIYIRAGESWERLELQNAVYLWHYTKKVYKNLKPMRVVSINGKSSFNRSFYRKSELFIPLRNLTLITAASMYALQKEIKRLAIGSLGIYPFPDNSIGYIKDVERLISSGSREEFFIEIPLMGMKKVEVIKRFYDKVPYRLTLSCAMPKKMGRKVLPCGACIKCREREEAFSKFL